MTKIELKKQFLTLNKTRKQISGGVVQWNIIQ